MSVMPRLPVAALAGLFFSMSLLAEDSPREQISFTSQIRPILSEHCFQCHGPDEKERKGGIRLDLHDGALASGDSGTPAIIPHKPDESELIARILSTEESEMMPPPKLQKPLNDRQKELLKRWISEGADYQGHWAFEPPQPPKSPFRSESKLAAQ